MDTWEKFKYASSVYFCQSDSAFVHKNNNYFLCKSPIDGYYFNNMFIENNIDINFNPFENIEFNLCLISFTDSKEIIRKFSNRLYFLGTSALMTKNIGINNLNIQIPDDIEIFKVSDSYNYFYDYITVMSEVKKENILTLLGVFDDKKMKDSDIHVYLAYSLGKPIGYLSAVKINNSAFIIDSAIIEEERNKGVLTSLSQYAVKDSINYQISSYSSLVSSPYSMNIIKKLGFAYEMSCDIWKYSK